MTPEIGERAPVSAYRALDDSLGYLGPDGRMASSVKMSLRSTSLPSKARVVESTPV